MQPRRNAILMAVAAAVALSACTITFFPDTSVDRPRPAASAVIERFESFSSSYRVGSRVSFRIRTNQPGYVTLTAFDPDGSVYVIARNVAVRGNRVESIPIPAPLGRTVFIAVPPTGMHMVRAHFTPEPTPERVRFVGISSRDAWLTQIVLEIRGFGYGAEDVAETRFEIRR